MPKLHVVVCSTRPGRQGPLIAHWAAEAATREGSFDVELVDLAEFALPLFDEANHPMRGQYEHEHTRRWAAKVAEADAFLFVMPEYDHAAPVPFVNAVTYLVREWLYKPAAFVSYGGISGGLRAVENAKTMLTTLKVMPIPEGVVLPFFNKQIEDGVFRATEPNEDAVRLTLGELRKWADALKTMR